MSKLIYTFAALTMSTLTYAGQAHANSACGFWGGDCGYTGSPIGDWAYGSYKGQCAAGQAVVGVSATAPGSTGHLHDVLCSGTFSSLFLQNSSCHAVAFDPGNNPDPWGNLADWDSGYYKAQCNDNGTSWEYVAGVAQSSSGHPDSILCCPLGTADGGYSATEVFWNQNSTDYASPDWDSGYYKGECAAGQPSWPDMAFGISADTTYNDGHALYCVSSTI